MYPNITLAIENYGRGLYGLGIYGLSECGNDVCESGESCSSCSSDCGACPAPAAPPAVDGGGGGGGDLVLYRWECNDWSECTPEGIQTRVCSAVGVIPDGFGKPAESRQCNYTLPIEIVEIPTANETKITRQIKRVSKEKIKESEKAPEVESITGRIVRFTERIGTPSQLFVGGLITTAIIIAIIIMRIESKGFFKR
ncbi:hypothetical protein HYX00_03885 [Candidatus Woesearchaeota archaeon]|nr:hypothetical protein [Candidatus Woesearchaeota archaeon]